jgi:hypothetical protein
MAILILTIVLGVSGQLKFTEGIDRTNLNSDTLYWPYTGSSFAIIIAVLHSNGILVLSSSKQWSKSA